MSVAHSAPSGSDGAASGASPLAASGAGVGHDTEPASCEEPPLLRPLDELESLPPVQYASDAMASVESAPMMKG